jgi:GTPase SAR1 family protein
MHQFKKGGSAQYPPWLFQPLHLSIEEMNDPRKVLSEFFDCYSLPNIRNCLKQLLVDALQAEQTAAAGHFTTCDKVEKLIEASWLLYNNRKTNNLQKRKLKAKTI